jgi:hypothetical protein
VRCRHRRGERRDHAGVHREAVLLGLTAAWASALVRLPRPRQQDQLWALVASRGSASLVVGGGALLWGNRSRLRGVVPLVALAGILDVAANGMVVSPSHDPGRHRGGSPAPIATMILAERCSARRCPPGLWPWRWP